MKKRIKDLRWAFFTYGHNMGDFTRALEIAKGMQSTGAQLHFYNHGGVHNHLLNKAKIPNTDLYPELSWEQHELIMDINRYKAKVGTPLPVTKEDWIAMTESDLKALSEFKPDAIYAGLNLSTFIAAPYAKIPYVTLLPTVNCPSFIENEMYNMPNTMEKNVFTRHLLPSSIKRKMMKRILLGDSAKDSLVSFNEARKHFGLEPIYNIIKLFKGDITLLPDLEELSGLRKNDLTEGYFYTGPIFAKPEMEVQNEIKKVFSRPGTNIYVSLGSSGFPEVLKKIISTLLNNTNYNIVCATTTILKPEELGENNERFFATAFLNAPLVNAMADIAIIHGGQGTIQTAVWAGTPVLGIGFQAEQQANIDGLVNQKMAVRIPIYKINNKSILFNLNIIDSISYRYNAKRMSNFVKQQDGVENAVNKMNDFALKMSK